MQSAFPNHSNNDSRTASPIKPVEKPTSKCSACSKISNSYKPYRFPRRLRLSGSKAFEAVYQVRIRQARGPLLVYARSNGLPFTRVGMSVPKRVGKAVNRNQVKRKIREAFRLNRHEWPSGLDLVIHVRPHQPLSNDEYARLIGQAAQTLAKRLRSKQA